MEKIVFDKVKFTWLRYVILFMCKFPIFSSKRFLWLFRSCYTHIIYKDNCIIDKITVKDLISLMYPGTVKNLQYYDCIYKKDENTKKN